MSFGGFSASATSSTETNFISGRFTAAYLADFGNWYLKPGVDVAVTQLRRHGYTETGTGGIALSVKGSNDSVVSVAPLLEFGAQLLLEGGGIARPYVRGGLTWLDNSSFDTVADFTGAPVGTTPFSMTTSIDNIVANVGAGVNFIDTNDVVLRLQYDGQFGEQTTQHGGAIKLSVPF